MAESKLSLNPMSLLNLIFGGNDSKNNTTVGGNERFEEQKAAENKDATKKSKFKKAMEQLTKDMNKEPELLKSKPLQLPGNPYDTSSAPYKVMEGSNSPLFASLNDIRSGKLKYLNEQTGGIMQAITGGLPKTVQRR